MELQGEMSLFSTALHPVGKDPFPNTQPCHSVGSTSSLWDGDAQHWLGRENQKTRAKINPNSLLVISQMKRWMLMVRLE